MHRELGGTQLAQLTPSDPRDIPGRVASCSTIKLRERLSRDNCPGTGWAAVGWWLEILCNMILVLLVPTVRSQWPCSVFHKHERLLCESFLLSVISPLLHLKECDPAKRAAHGKKLMLLKSMKKKK